MKKSIHSVSLKSLPSLVLIFGLALSLSAQQVQSPTRTTPIAAMGGVPRLVNYTGRASDDEGKPISGVAGVTFAIYKEQEGGTPLWIEVQNVNTDARGNFTAQLGATKPNGLELGLFSSGEARWLGVSVNGGAEKTRSLLISVPYALKAVDAETIGGLPPSAFVLAGSAASGSQTSHNAAATQGVIAPASSSVTTTGGTVNSLPLFTTGTNIQSSALTQTGTGATAKIGIGTTAPATTLDVKGAETVRGALTLPATAAATATAGTNSQPENHAASSFNSTTKAAVNQTFQWLAEPAANNTATPSGTLNLRYGLGTAAPNETGLKLSSKGIFTFAPGQTFPGGSGTVTSVALTAPSSDFTVTGSPITKAGTLALKWTVAPTSANTPNAIVKRDVNGDFTARVASALLVNATQLQASTTISGNIAVLGYATAPGTSQSTGVYGQVADSGYGVYGDNTGSGWGVFGESAGQDGVHGLSHSSASGVAGINTAANGTGVYGSATGWAMEADGNALQGRTYGGWVKAMVFVSPNGIVSCFNSTLAGAAATTAPCGFSYDKPGIGDYIIDFGFQVDDRFFSLTNTGAIDLVASAVCTDSIGVPCANAIGPTQVEISTLHITNLQYIDAKLYLVVY